MRARSTSPACKQYTTEIGVISCSFVIVMAGRVTNPASERHLTTTRIVKVLMNRIVLGTGRMIIAYLLTAGMRWTRGRQSQINRCWDGLLQFMTGAC